MRLLALGMTPLLGTALVTACSSSPSGASAAAGDAGADASSWVTASFHMEETVAAGQEIFKCQYVALPDVQAFMVKGQHSYTPGSHHLLMYTTDLTAIPAGQAGVQDCYEGSGSTNSIMSHVRGVLYAGQVPQGSEVLPAGIGLGTTPGQVLIFQVHYLNATAASLDAKVDVALSLDTGDDIVTKAGIFFFYDPYIDVPAGAMAKASMRCVVPDDVTLIYASSHYHSRGDDYGAYIDPSVDTLASKPFYTSSSWSSPPNQQMSMPIKAGSHLRFECDYNNAAGTASYFQGQSAQTNEMCMFIGLYYPEMSPLADFCLSGPDMFGTGTATCDATLSCLQACGKVSLSFGGGASTCEQACMVASCPNATAALVPVADCIKNSCAMPCSDTKSAGCEACIQASCTAAYGTCHTLACQ